MDKKNFSVKVRREIKQGLRNEDGTLKNPETQHQEEVTNEQGRPLSEEEQEEVKPEQGEEQETDPRNKNRKKARNTTYLGVTIAKDLKDDISKQMRVQHISESAVVSIRLAATMFEKKEA